MLQLTNRPGSTLDPAAIERLLATCGDGGTEIAASLLGTFFGDAPHLLAELHRALVQNAPEDARRAAHTLKSQGLLFGALVVVHLASEIERRARDNDLAGTAALVAELEAEYGLARVALEITRRELLEESFSALAA